MEIMSMPHAAQTYQILIVHHTVVDIPLQTVIMCQELDT